MRVFFQPPAQLASAPTHGHGPIKPSNAKEVAEAHLPNAADGAKVVREVTHASGCASSDGSRALRGSAPLKPLICKQVSATGQ